MKLGKLTTPTDLIFERFDVVLDDCRIGESVDVVAEVGPRRRVLQFRQDLPEEELDSSLKALG